MKFKHIIISIILLSLVAVATSCHKSETKASTPLQKCDSVAVLKPDSVKPVFLFDTTNLYVPRRKPNWPRWVKYHIIYDSIITKYATQFNIDRTLVEAIITWESNWTAGGTNASNCSGLMQVMGGSHNPDKNVRSGCSIFNKYRSSMNSWFSSHFNIQLSDEDLIKSALTAYNRGCGGARKYYRKHIADGKIVHSSYAKSVFWVYFQIFKRTEK